MAIPVNLEDLLQKNKVESNRIEFKEGWNPDRIYRSILSYSGPDRSISMDAIFKAENLRSRRYKNRRLGDYLKELELTEGRGTGIPTIQKELRDNGSTPAILETDEGRSYFLIDIPCHPEFQSGQMEEIYIEDKLKEVVKRVLTALSEKEMSRSEILGMIEVPDNWYYKGIYLNPLLSNKLIKSSQEKKKSPKQSYMITRKGLDYLDRL